MRELLLVLVMVSGCATVPPADRETMEYKRIDARLRQTERFNALKVACRAAGGIVVVEGGSSRLPRLPMEMNSARCLERSPHVAF